MKEDKCKMNEEREKADGRLTEEVKQREEDQERQGTPTSCSKFVLV